MMIVWGFEINFGRWTLLFIEAGQFLKMALVMLAQKQFLRQITKFILRILPRASFAIVMVFWFRRASQLLLALL